MKDARRKTLWLSVIFSAFGPFVLLGALWMNTSMTQLGDFIRRTTELGVLVLALWTYLKLEKISSTLRANYQKRIYLASGLVLWLSALVLTMFLIINLVTPVYPEGNVVIGLSVAVLGMLVNGYFAIRYKLFDQQSPNAVMDTQSKLYQAKTLVDINVTITLLSVIVLTDLNWRYWIDNLGTFLIILYLLYRGFCLLLDATKINTSG